MSPKKASKKKKPLKLPGHYCRVCGQRHTNEKFSGKGLAANICKECFKKQQTEKRIIRRAALLQTASKQIKDTANWINLFGKRILHFIKKCLSIPCVINKFFNGSYHIPRPSKFVGIILAIALEAIGLILLLCIFCFYTTRTVSLVKNGVYTKANVTDCTIYVMPEGGTHFSVDISYTDQNGRTYNNEITTKVRKKLGELVPIIYHKENPDIFLRKGYYNLLFPFAYVVIFLVFAIPFLFHFDRLISIASLILGLIPYIRKLNRKALLHIFLTLVSWGFFISIFWLILGFYYMMCFDGLLS